MNKIILLALLVCTNVYADGGITFEPNERITTSGWVNGKYESKTTTIDSTGQRATTSGWVNGRYETDVTTINSNGDRATTSGWHNGQYITKESIIQK